MLILDPLNTVLIIGIGAVGAVMTQYLDIKKYHEKYGKRLDIDKKVKYLSMVISKKQEEKQFNRDRIATCEDKAIDAKGEAEKDAREFIDSYRKENKRIELDIVELDKKRNDLITNSSEMGRMQPNWMYIISIIIGACFSGFIYLLDVIKGSPDLTVSSLVNALVVGGSWPILYAKFVGNKSSDKIDALITRYDDLYEVIKENIEA